MNNEDRIRDYLLKINYDYDLLTEKEKAYLKKIEEAITDIFRREEDAKKLLTNNHLSVKNISEKTNISRQTIYNYKALIDFVELRANEFKKYDISNNIQELEEKNQDLMKQIELMQVRDSEIEELKIEMKILKSKLLDKEEELKRTKQRLSNSRN